MKRLWFLALALFLAVVGAMAQYSYGSTVTVLSGATNNVAASATNSYTSDIVLNRSDGLGLFVSCKAVAAHTGEVVFVLKRGVESSSVETAETFRISLTCAGTSTVNLFTNLTIGHEQFIRLTAVENVTAVAVTNVTLKASIKR